VAIAACALGAGAGVAAVRYGARGLAVPLAVVAGLAALRHVEVVFAGLFLSAFVAPAVVGYQGASVLIVAATAFLLLRALALGQPVIGAWFIGAYAVVFLVAAIHGDPNAAVANSLVKYLAYPVFAVATASAVRSSRIRQRVTALMLAIMLIQAPFLIAQAVAGISVFGAYNGGAFGDFVTGTLGSSGSGRVGVVGAIGATILFALAIERIWKPKLLAIGVVIFLSFGVFSIARAVFFFTPVAFGAVVLASALFARRSIRARRLIAVTVVFLLVAPALVVAMSTLYPGVNEEISTPAKIENYLFNRNSGNAQERGGQLNTALSIATRDGLGQLLLGEGPGITWVNADPHLPLSPDSPYTLTSEQNTSGIWIGRVIVEAGLLGVIAFVGLLVAIVDMARRARHATAPRSFDAGLLVATTGVAVLALIAATYTSVLDEPPSAIPFWTLVGMTIAIGRDAVAPNRAPDVRTLAGSDSVEAERAA
jgi:hypothetical protein